MCAVVGVGVYSRMRVCVGVCVRACVCVFAHARALAHACLCALAHVRARAQVCLCALVCVSLIFSSGCYYTHVHTHACI